METHQAMNDITIITPPDKVHSQELSILLVYPSKIIKEQLQNIIADFDYPFHIYLYEEDFDPYWLLDVFQQSDIVLIDIDNCTTKVRDLVSYFITKDKTYWLTNGGDNYYNIISRNRIFDLDFLKSTIGGKLEKVQ